MKWKTIIGWILIVWGGGGRLTIRSSQEDGRVVVAFTDSGPGISEENLQRLLEPFFSTKTERGGTGLGLSVCHGIAKAHDGKIYATSKQGKGTTFFIELPVNSPPGRTSGYGT
jgi:signal transduction histidine kinase